MRRSLRSLTCVLASRFAQSRWAMNAWCAVLASCALSLALAEQVSADQWKTLNVPIVRSYLLSLKSSQVGTRLSGVQLSDGTFRLKGQTFVANLSARKRGLHAYKFATTLDGQRFEIHYLWVDKGFKVLDLKSFPACAGDWLEPSGRAGINGEPYSQAQVFPDGNILVTTCQLTSPQPSGQGKPKAKSSSPVQ
jgi:hypothetical protein